jgi:hypothetical protein
MENQYESKFCLIQFRSKGSKINSFIWPLRIGEDWFNNDYSGTPYKKYSWNIL